MRRREFIRFVGGGTAAWPIAALGQQSAMPVIGFLEPTSFDKYAQFVEAFRKGLREVGFVEGHNVAIEYRWAEGEYARLSGLAADLVQQKVAVIVATGITAARAAKAATSTIPIVFNTGGDPVKFGLITSFSKPGQNVTGVASLGKVLVAKQLEVLHELVPRADSIAFLVNPNNAVADLDTVMPKPLQRRWEKSWPSLRLAPKMSSTRPLQQSWSNMAARSWCRLTRFF